jgi:hypothetical protein
MSSSTCLTSDELAKKIKNNTRYIQERLNDTVLLEGVHCIRPFGRRKILYIWERIENDFMGNKEVRIPYCNRLYPGSGRDNRPDASEPSETEFCRETGRAAGGCCNPVTNGSLPHIRMLFLTGIMTDTLYFDDVIGQNLICS